MVKLSLNCNGGPLHGKDLGLGCLRSGTLPFTLHGQTGRYVHHVRDLGYPNGKRAELKWVKS